MKFDIGIGCLRIGDRIVVAIDSLEIAPSMTAQIFRAPSATTSDIENPVPRIFRSRVERALDRFLLTSMRVITIANESKNPLTLEGVHVHGEVPGRYGKGHSTSRPRYGNDPSL